MQNDTSSPQKPDKHRYLPTLTWLLLLAVVLVFIRDFLQRPTTEHRKRAAALEEALRLIPAHYARTVDEGALYQAAMKGMVSSLEDPHSHYLERPEMEQAAAQTEGEFGGIGVTIVPHEEGALIMEILDGPAKKAGVRAGELIVAVDGRPCRGVPLPEISSRIRGKIGTAVEVTLQRVGSDKKETVKITRARIEVESVRHKMLEDRIGHIRIDQFDRHSLEKVEKAIESLKQGGALKALMVDVRLNPGGLLDQAVGVSDLFLSEGVIVRLQSRLKEEEVVFKADAQTAVPAEMPVVVLTDFGSASAAEVFAGALQAHHRAVIVGAKTFGKGAVNRIYPLADGSGLVLTVAYYSVDEDKTIEGKGIEPDVKVGELAPLPPGADEKTLEKWQSSFWAAHEEQLKRAVELLKEKVR